MSKYKIHTGIKFRTRESLEAALLALDVPVEIAKQENGLALVGYLGDARRERCTFVIRRQHVGSNSNDLGFTWDAEAACYYPVVSDYDERHTRAVDLLNRTRQGYANIEVEREARRRGMTVQRKVEAGVIRVRLVKR